MCIKYNLFPNLMPPFFISAQMLYLQVAESDKCHDTSVIQLLDYTTIRLLVFIEPIFSFL